MTWLVDLQGADADNNLVRKAAPLCLQMTRNPHLDVVHWL